MLLIMSLMIASFTSIMMANTPMMLGLNVLVCSMSLAFLIYKVMSSWYAFILFLIYVGGMLMLFAYMLSLTPNIFMMLGSHLSYMMMMMFTALMYLKKMNLKPSLNMSYEPQSTFLYSSAPLSMFMLMVVILLIIMVLVSKMIAVSKGPLRPFNLYV